MCDTSTSLTDTPDLSTLPQRMRYAAEAMREAEARNAHPPISGWSPWWLEARSRDWEIEDRETAERDSGQVEKLARELHGINWSWGEFEGLSHAVQVAYRANAQRLLDAGWRKD